MQARVFNPQIFLECLCYSAFGGLIFFLVRSGKYLSYVTPRMEPYLSFTAIVMLIWACVGLFRMFRPQHKVRSAHCFVLAIPVLLLLLPHSPLGTSDFSGNYIGGNTFSGQAGQYSTSQKQVPPAKASPSVLPGNPAGDSVSSEDNPSATGKNDLSSQNTEPTESLDTTVPDTQNNVPDASSPIDGNDLLLEDIYSTDLPGLDAANKKITVSNDDFSIWLSEIYVNMEKYKGYKVVMTGFVFKDPEIFKEDEFVTARLMMSCCVADLLPAGLICKYDKASELKKDSWVTVEGTLFMGQYEYDGQKYDDPQIHVTKITSAEAVEGYIYP